MSGDLDAGLVLAATVPAPSIEYGKLSPMLIVFGAAVIGVLVEAFVPRRLRYLTHMALALAALIAALVAVIALAGTQATAAVGAVAVDGVTLFLQGTLLVVSILGVLFIRQRLGAPPGGPAARAPPAPARGGAGCFTAACPTRGRGGGGPRAPGPPGGATR